MAGPAPTVHKYVHGGRTIYEWTQTLDEVVVTFNPPEGVTAKALAITIAPTKLTVGMKGNPPFLAVRLSAAKAKRPMLAACARALRLTHWA